MPVAGGAGALAGGTAPPAADRFGYQPPPHEPQLPREVLKWLQGLDMSVPVRRLRTDLSNGFAAAELLSKFWPSDVQMHSYANGTGAACKRDNWEQLARAAGKHGLALPAALVQGTIQGTPGAATQLLELLYEHFTGKKVQRAPLLPTATDKSAAAAAVAAATLAPSLSFGEPAAAPESGVLRAIRTTAGAAVALEFGAAQTASAGDAATLRRRFAQGAAGAKPAGAAGGRAAG